MAKLQTLIPPLLFLLLALALPSPSSARLGATSCHGSLFFSDSSAGTFFISHAAPKPFPCFLSVATVSRNGDDETAPTDISRFFPVLMSIDEVTSRSFFVRERVRDYHTLFSFYSFRFTDKTRKEENAEAVFGTSSSPVIVNDEVKQPEKANFQTLNIDTPRRRSPWLTDPSFPVRTPWTDSLRFPQRKFPQKPDSSDFSARSPWSTASSSSQNRSPWMDSLRFPWKVSLTQKTSSHPSTSADTQKPARVDFLGSSLTETKISSWIGSLRSLMWTNANESPANRESNRFSTVDSQRSSWIPSNGIRGSYRSLPREEYDDIHDDSSWFFMMNELSSIAFSLLLGAACGAIVAGVFSLVWSFFLRESDDEEEEKDIGILHSYQLLESPKACEKLDKSSIKCELENEA